MFNFFRNKKAKRQLTNLSASFAILNEFQRRGLLHFHRQGSLPTGEGRGGVLLIEQSLATVELARGAQGFRDFLDKVAQWQNYQLLQQAYESYRIDIETRAVREAINSLPTGEGRSGALKDSDIQRIRQNARDNMPPLDPDKLPSLLTGGAGGGSEFDLYIIRANAPSATAAIESNYSPSLHNGRGMGGGSLPTGEGRVGALVALGHWDGTHLEMALYDDIKHNLG